MGMKKKLAAVLIVCLAISSLLFAVCGREPQTVKTIYDSWPRRAPLMPTHNLSSIRRMEKQAVIGMASLHSGLLNRHIIC